MKLHAVQQNVFASVLCRPFRFRLAAVSVCSALVVEAPVAVPAEVHVWQDFDSSGQNAQVIMTVHVPTST